MITLKQLLEDLRNMVKLHRLFRALIIIIRVAVSTWVEFTYDVTMYWLRKLYRS